MSGMENYSFIMNSYKVLRKLGDGGFGDGFAGVRKSDRLPVAIKKLNPEKMLLVEGIPAEVHYLKKVANVPGVAKLLDWFDNTLIIERPTPVMDMFDYITDEGPIQEDRARQLFKKVVEIVKGVHAAGVLHGDIKDENILISKDDVWLIDFGCSSDLIDDYTYTDFKGTKIYAAPEVFDGSYEGVPTTVWTLGILLFSMLTGDAVFQDTRDIFRGKIIYREKVSDSAKDLIQQCLTFAAYKRPSIEDILQHPWMSA